jgi:hypothetical protein
MTTGSTFNTSPDKLIHKQATKSDGRKKPARSRRQTEWSQVSWANHGIRGLASGLLNALVANKLFAEAGQVEAAIKKVQAANIAKYKQKYPEKALKNKALDKSQPLK